MRFHPASLTGAFLVEMEPIEDARGSFARTFCRHEFAAHGLATDLVQCNVSCNRRRGTLRGLHFQRAPHEEAKLVTCVQGAIFDVIVDLRPGSPTLHRWQAFELAADAPRALYVPAGFAHGFQALEDDARVFYQMTEFYHPELAAGLRWDDPVLAISWPIPDPIVSPRDASFPLLGGEP